MVNLKDINKNLTKLIRIISEEDSEILIEIKRREIVFHEQFLHKSTVINRLLEIGN